MLLTLSTGVVKFCMLDIVIGLNSTFFYYGGTVFSGPIYLISVGNTSGFISLGRVCAGDKDFTSTGLELDEVSGYF